MIAEEGKATSWRLRESTRVRELAATHRLGQIRRFLMLEEQKTWKREFGFNRIETAAMMDENGFCTSPVSEPFFYRNMSNSRHPHTPDEFTLEMKVYVERLRMKIVLSQPAPPQYDPLPRRAAIGTGSDQPGTLRFETSTDKEGYFTLEISMDDFLNSNCTSPEQKCVLLQLDVGMYDDNETTTQRSPRSRGVREINEEAAAGRDDRVVNRAKQAVWPGSVDSEIITFLRRRILRRMYCLLVVFPLCLSSFCCCISPVLSPIFQRGAKGDRSDWDVPDA